MAIKKGAQKIRSLFRFLPNISVYRREFDETKCFLIKDDELLEEYNEILEKVRNNIKN